MKIYFEERKFLSHVLPDVRFFVTAETADLNASFRSAISFLLHYLFS